MMVAAKKACHPDTKLLAVTVLTSLDDRALHQVGQNTPAQDQVKTLAVLTKDAGLDGVVCSPEEIAPLRKTLGNDFILMTPGIRPKGSNMDDQKRVMAPKDALDLGATHLVIGRPITQAADPNKAIEQILEAL
jgi:orotidine-5'-phosphate decarboxylase